MSHSTAQPVFSLILATVDRTATLPRFLDSLANQAGPAFELIVVDQNEDDRVPRLLGAYRYKLTVRHIRASRGLSRARNAGIACAGGQIVAFPDDDCWYPPGLLARVDELLASNDWDGLSGTVADETGRPVVVRWDSRGGLLTPTNLWRRACSVSMFLRASLVKKVGGFDETLGAGAQWGAGEETDYLLRAAKARARICYRPDVQVGHPDPLGQFDARAVMRARSYGLGLGRLLCRHRLPLWFKIWMCLRPLGGSLLWALRGKGTKAKYHWAVFRGRLSGWMGPDR